MAPDIGQVMDLSDVTWLKAGFPCLPLTGTASAVRPGHSLPEARHQHHWPLLQPWLTKPEGRGARPQLRFWTWNLSGRVLLVPQCKCPVHSGLP